MRGVHVTRDRYSIRYSTVLFGFANLFILLIIGAYVYLRFGPVPVAVTDPAFPFEKQIVKIAVSVKKES
jgi:thiosulfate dehydrogenase